MKDFEKILVDYRTRFGEDLKYPPFDYGHIDMAVETLLQLGRIALETNKPVDWSKHFKKLPKGAVS